MLSNISGADLRAMKVFQTVAEAGGFSAAVQILNISQPTISSQITSLETRLGFKLCERGRSGFRLTDRGRLVLRHHAQLMDQMNLFTQEMSSLAGRMVGKLKLGIIDTLAHSEKCKISDAIRTFRGRNQDVTLQILVAPYQQLERFLLEDNLDVAVAIFPERLKTIEYVDVFTEDQAIYCGQGHPFFGQSQVDPFDLQMADWVETGYAAEQHAIFVPRSPISTAMATNQEAVVQFLQSGYHVGYLPTDYAKAWEEKGELWRLPMPELSYTATFSVAHVAKKTVNPMLQTFKSDLLNAQLGVSDAV